MYDKITIIEGDINQIVELLDMNNYNFENINQNLYVYNEETEYVCTILQDENYKFIVNDDMEV